MKFNFQRLSITSSTLTGGCKEQYSPTRGQLTLELLKTIIWVVVVGQLAERLLPTLEVCGSNPGIGKMYC